MRYDLHGLVECGVVPIESVVAPPVCEGLILARGELATDLTKQVRRFALVEVVDSFYSGVLHSDAELAKHLKETLGVLGELVVVDRRGETTSG